MTTIRKEKLKPDPHEVGLDNVLRVLVTEPLPKRLVPRRGGTANLDAYAPTDASARLDPFAHGADVPAGSHS